MRVAIQKEELEILMEEQKLAERKLILEGYEQAMAGDVKDFDEVFDRLEQKYKDAEV